MKTALPVELVRHLRRLLKRSRQRYAARLKQCQRGFSEPAVHDLRVETRRALALLDLVEILRIARTLKKARRTLKQRLDAFDQLRDTQVQLALLQPWLRKYPEAREYEKYLRDGELGLVKELRREIRQLKSRRVERTMKALARDLGELPTAADIPALKVLAAPLSQVFVRVAELNRQINPLLSETIHRTRIAFKKFRYLCELLRDLLPGLTAHQLRAMHDWQTRMGDIQDVEVLLNEIERAVKHGAVRLESVKRLHATLAKRRVVLIKTFLSTANRLERFQPRLVLGAP